MSDRTVLAETVGVARVVTLHRPDKRNALSLHLLTELATALTEADADEAVRGVVLTGGPHVFSAGADLGEASAATDIAPILRYLVRLQQVGQQIEALSKPVVAAIHGYCLTGGLELAMACDRRICTPDARFAITSAQIGSFPGMGASRRLPRIVGRSVATDLLMTGRHIDATEAHAVGLVDAVTETTETAAHDWVAEIAHAAPLSVWLTKLALADADVTGLRTETILAALAFTSQDRAEGMSAFLEHRAPRFQGR